MKTTRQITAGLIALMAAAVLVGCGSIITDDEETSGSIVFDSTNTQTDLRIMFGTGASQQLLLASGEQPNLSRDGSMIAFARDVDIYTINTDGAGLVNVTNPDFETTPRVGSIASDPAISPDGETITYVMTATAPGAIPEIRIINTDSTGDALLFANADDPTFSPDGEQIAFVRGSDIFTINLDDKVETNVTNNGIGVSVHDPEFNSAGTQIVFASEPVVPNPTSSIRLLTLIGGAQVEVTNDGSAPTFNPAGTKAAFVRDGMIYSINVAGTGLTQLTIGLDHNNPSWAVTP